MKLIIGLTIIMFSSLSFSDSIYVRKTSADAGISAADAEKVRDSLRKSVTSQGHKLVNTPGQAQWALRAMVSKADNGSYVIKVERIHNGKLIGTNHGSDMSLDEAIRLATTNLVEAMGKALPEKTVSATSVVNDDGSASSDSRSVAENTPAETVNAAVEAKHPNYIKNWSIALGPVVSNALVGSSNNGTKFGLTLAYNLGITEHFNMLYMYDANFNTASVGGTATTDFAIGLKYFIFDRLSDFSPWIMLDANYGGGNRANDATFGGGGTIGVDLFRTQASTFFVYLRELVFSTSNGSTLANLPNLTQFMLGVNF